MGYDSHRRAGQQQGFLLRETVLLMDGQGGQRWPAGTLALRGKPENSAAHSESSSPATAPRAARMFLWRHLVSKAETTPWRERQGPQTEAPTLDWACHPVDQ